MSKLLLLAFVTTVLNTACAETTVTFLTQAPPGRTATVDVETETLTLSRGLAVAFECVEWTDIYSGPCRDLDVTILDEDILENIPAHLDALSGQSGFSRGEGFDDAQTVGGPLDRQGGALLALAEGTTTLSVQTAGAPVVMSVIVIAPPAPVDAGDDDE